MRGDFEAHGGRPRPASTDLAQEGIEGAIWHTIYLQTASSGAGTLPELSGYLAYVVLAPFLAPRRQRAS